jgi:hypothetical protein
MGLAASAVAVALWQVAFASASAVVGFCQILEIAIRPGLRLTHFGYSEWLSVSIHYSAAYSSHSDPSSSSPPDSSRAFQTCRLLFREAWRLDFPVVPSIVPAQKLV